MVAVSVRFFPRRASALQGIGITIRFLDRTGEQSEGKSSIIACIIVY